MSVNSLKIPQVHITLFVSYQLARIVSSISTKRACRMSAENQPQILNPAPAQEKTNFPWREVLSRSSLPFLGLAASYGVYSFTIHYVNIVFAIITAAAFELVYIGLAVAKDLDERQHRRARLISMSAVGVSACFNWMAGVIDTNPGWFEGLTLGQKTFLAFLHGAPLSLLGYFVADLLMHSSTGEALTKAAQDIIEKLQSELDSLQSRFATLQKDHETLQSSNNDLQNRLTSSEERLTNSETQLTGFRNLVAWLQNAGQPFAFQDGEFRIVEIKQPELPAAIAIDTSLIASQVSILAKCLQARKISAAGAELTGREPGSVFGIGDFDSELGKLLTNTYTDKGSF
jgi:phage shock protein PspC (stress-responsive transcriptional regulator)/FtsZ-binding cell division protein ZapB